MAINLTKGQKVNLRKSGDSGLGEILINLNWNARIRKKGFFASLFSNDSNIDLDLGCLYELKSGKKGTVQALGKAFGSLSREPYVSLDGDDRTGENLSGENLRIDGNRISQIKRVLVYTFIYEGVANWQEADAVVTIKYPGAEDIIVRLDEYNSSKRMCALALFENVSDSTFSVQKLIQFFSGHSAMDGAFNWGLKWVPGRK